MTRTRRKSSTVSRRVRSLRAKQGWVTRRRNLRSRAAKQGWVTRRRKSKRATRPSRIEPKAREPLRDFIIALSYKSKKSTRIVDYTVTATSVAHAKQVLKQEQPWTKDIPWTKVTIAEGPVSRHARGTVQPRLEMMTSKSSSRKRTKSK